MISAGGVAGDVETETARRPVIGRLLYDRRSLSDAK